MTREQLAATQAYFRENHYPGPGIVQGMAKNGIVQQVIWFPKHTVSKLRAEFSADDLPNGRLRLIQHNRSGTVVKSFMAVNSINMVRREERFLSQALRHVDQTNHMVTTSRQADYIADQLQNTGVLYEMAASLVPEQDKRSSPGITGVITSAARAPHRIHGAAVTRRAQLYVHQAYRPREMGEALPRPSIIPFDAHTQGMGVGAHAYIGGDYRPFIEPGGRPNFPIADTAEETLELYRSLLGPKRSYNVAVRALGDTAVLGVLAVNASGEQLEN